MTLTLLFLLSCVFIRAPAVKDPCTFVTDDYCFRFGQMSCYVKICECEQKNCTDTNNCILSPWCDPSGKTIAINETFTDIDRGCDSLKRNCLTQTQNHGYCFLYREGCPKSEEVQKKLGNEALKNSRKDCPKWKRKCAVKYPKHFACRMYKRKCGPIDFPIGNDSTDGGSSNIFDELTDDANNDRNDTKVSPKLLRICNKWQRKCEEKYPKHYACRQFRRNCRSVDLQLSLNTTSDGDSRGANSSVDEATESGEHEGEVQILKRCQQWKKICARKYPGHYTCRQYRRKCGFMDALANSSRNDTSVSPISVKSAPLNHNSTTNKTSIVDRESDTENEESDSIELES